MHALNSSFNYSFRNRGSFVTLPRNLCHDFFRRVANFLVLFIGLLEGFGSFPYDQISGQLEFYITGM